MKKIVIKLGGSSLDGPSTLKELANLVAHYKSQDIGVVIVHGGGPAINQALTEKNILWKFIDGQRQTTAEMMAVINEVLAKKINFLVTQALNHSGIRACGLSGADDEILYCRQASPELMQVGQILSVDTQLIERVLNWEDEPVCVVAPIGYDHEGKKYNINADWAAAQIAMALHADELVYLTDQSGVLDANKKLLQYVTPNILEKLINEGVIVGGMLTKVRTMITALKAGIRQVAVVHVQNASLYVNAHANAGTRLIDGMQIVPSSSQKLKGTQRGRKQQGQQPSQGFGAGKAQCA